MTVCCGNEGCFNAKTLNGLKRTIEIMEGSLERKDARIKELEEQVEEYAVYLRSLPYERIDW